MSLYFTMGRPFPLKITLAHGGYAPPSNTCFLRPTPLRIPNGISIGSAVFAQLTAASPYTLPWAAPFPLKIAHADGGRRPGLIHGCLGPPESTSSTTRRAVPLFFARLTIVTDRQTDHATPSVTISRIDVILQRDKFCMHTRLRLWLRILLYLLA